MWRARSADFADFEDLTPDNPLQGEGFSFPEIGWPALHVHPRYIVDDESYDYFGLWQVFNKSGILPEAGGWLDQAAKTLEIFAILDRAQSVIQSMYKTARPAP